MKYKPHLVTYPRSGAHYFNRVFEKVTNFKIEHSHSVNWLFSPQNKKQRIAITIVRDPRESIASYIAHEQNKFIDYSDNISDSRVDHIVTEYVIMYNYLYEHADYVIDFNDLVSHPEETVKKLFDLLDVEEKDYHLFDGDFGEEDSHFIETSKNLPFYNTDRLGSHNIDLCYFYYYKLLERKIGV
jgi:hypothetical protein